MGNIIERIRDAFIKNADRKTLESGKHFFKEEIKVYGVKNATVWKISKEFLKKVRAQISTSGEQEKDIIFNLCNELWQSGYMEESFIACEWSYSMRKKFEPEDFKLFEHWVDNYVTNWASCDTFCNHTVGAFIEMYPEYIRELKKWAKSKNRWTRRASAVSLIVPAKKGKFLKDIFEIAGILLLDKDDLVQKGYGWMLKVASQAHQKEVFDFVMKNNAVMPRTALRYAIEKMPEEMRKRAMGKTGNRILSNTRNTPAHFSNCPYRVYNSGI
jgi:3-methyladenine DNA glycosylase AlkD